MMSTDHWLSRVPREGILPCGDISRNEELPVGVCVKHSNDGICKGYGGAISQSHAKDENKHRRSVDFGEIFKTEKGLHPSGFVHAGVRLKLSRLRYHIMLSTLILGPPSPKLLEPSEEGGPAGTGAYKIGRVSCRHGME